jgi:N-acetylglucosamine-6-phosphate deacetylase
VALRANLDLDINPRNTWSPEHSSQSMSEIRKIENAGVTVLFGHDDAQWKGLLKGVEFYD